MQEASDFNMMQISFKNSIWFKYDFNMIQIKYDSWNQYDSKFNMIHSDFNMIQICVLWYHCLKVLNELKYGHSLNHQSVSNALR